MKKEALLQRNTKIIKDYYEQLYPNKWENLELIAIYKES
jgi:hypothetical protein